MTYLILTLALVGTGVYGLRQKERAEQARTEAYENAVLLRDAENKAERYKEALAQSYVGLQALSEKLVEAQWIAQDGQYLQPGVWIGDRFVEVDEAEAADTEVGQQVAADFDTAASPLRRIGVTEETYDWKAEMP